MLFSAPEPLRDPSAFSAAFRRHAPAALAAANAVLHNLHAAEDVVQEVFAALWARPDLFAPERGSLAGLVRVMARSRALDRLRAGGAAASATSRLRGVPVPAESPADVAERREILRAVRRALDALPHEQRAAVLLHHVRGLSDRELATVTGVPLGTAKSRIRLGTRRAQLEGAVAAA